MSWLQNKLKTWENNKMARKEEEIQREATAICTQLGEKQFQRAVLEYQIDEGNRRLVELSKEMQELKAPKAADSKPESAVAPTSAREGSNEVAAS